MSLARFIRPPDVLIEIGQSSMKVVQNGTVREVPLERSPNGALTDSCKERVTECLREFGGAGMSRPRAICAIGARGVSLRRMKLPAMGAENLDQMVGLQIESEFPLAPNQLAWGYCAVREEGRLPSGTSRSRDLVVVAVKREAVEAYRDLIARCGLEPVFTLSALAGSAMVPTGSDAYGVLDVGRSHSELITFEEGAPTAVRSLPWGGEDITRTLSSQLGISREAAEKLKLQSSSALTADQRLAARQAVERSVTTLVASLEGLWSGTKLYLTGQGARADGLAAQLGRLLESPCELVQPAAETGSAALSGLRAESNKNGDGATLVIRIGKVEQPRQERAPGLKWVAIACVLALALVSLRYWEVLLRKPGLARRVAEIKTTWRDQPDLDRELSFFRYLETNRPPYLESLAVIAQSVGGGTKLETITLNRRGDLSLKGSMPSADQAAGFRNKLIESGRFDGVVLEEQTPVQNEQKVTVRITAHGKTPVKQEAAPSTTNTNLAPAAPVNPKKE